MTVQTHVVVKSANAKLGPMAATYRTQASCPTSCPLLNNGCYATGRIFHIPKKFGREDVAAVDALADKLPEGAGVRFNVSGDFLDADGQPDWAHIEACNSLVDRRPDLAAWSYTHAWRDMDPTWFTFVVNASCETAEDIADALSCGWQPVVVDDGDLTNTFIGGRRVTQCPNQTHGVTCDECRACGVDTRTRPVIAFAIHGATRAKARATITRERS